MSDKPSAMSFEERLNDRYPPMGTLTIREVVRDAAKWGYFSGRSDALDRVIEMLRSEAAMMVHHHLDQKSGGIGSRPYQFADWLKSKRSEIIGEEK